LQLTTKQMMKILRLKRHEERRIRQGHPWVFSNEIDVAATPLSEFAAGSLAQLQSARDEFLAYVYVNPHALICARVISRQPQWRDMQHVLLQQLQRALELRTMLFKQPYYRWFFGESDGLPGLVLDRFDDVIVGQITTVGMEALRAPIVDAVRELLQPRVFVWKNDAGSRQLEGLPEVVEAVVGDMPEELTVKERDLLFKTPLVAGQKTGWFYDQAANRQRMLRYLPENARVLDACSYVGAWAITALSHGARLASCIDSSATALAYAERNASLNKKTITPLQADVFVALQDLLAAGQSFEMVIIDPPAFIKRKKDAARGQAAYRKLNQALRLVADQGVLISCSCSYHFSAAEHLATLAAAARQAECRVQVLEQGGQSPDHPILPALAETAYLNTFFCRVTREPGTR
jgi:23S rRNA (cytosine1962-C5)-methyltransferase